MLEQIITNFTGKTFSVQCRPERASFFERQGFVVQPRLTQHGFVTLYRSLEPPDGSKNGDECEDE